MNGGTRGIFNLLVIFVGGTIAPCAQHREWKQNVRTEEADSGMEFDSMPLC